MKVFSEFRRFEPVFGDSALFFHGLQSSERRLIEQRCRELDRRFDFQPKAVYTPEEIAQGSFVPLLIAGDEIDRNDKHRSLNAYSKVVCEACGACDLTSVPDPFIIRRPDRMADLANAANGVRIVSARLWRDLEPMLGSWVRTGRVTYDDTPDEVSPDFISIMPTTAIGPYVNAVIRKRCDVCGRPVEVRMAEPTEPLMWTLDVVTNLGPANAPIALIGNWYGAVHRGKSPRLHWPVVISGSLHERLHQMNPVGFVCADRVIETSTGLQKLGIAY